MAVYRAKNGWCYKGRIPVPFQKGKYKDYYKSGFKKKSDAIKAEQAFRDSYSTNMSDLTLDRIVALYHENYRMQNVKESTLIGDESYYNHHIKPVLGNYRLNDITPQAVERWKSYMINKPKFDKKRNSNEHYSASSVNHAKNVLSKYLSYAVRLGYIPYNPCHNVPGYINKEEIKDQKLDNFWEVDEFKKFIQCVDNDRYSNAFTFLFYTGLRESEMFALQWKDIDFNNHTVSIKKSITSKTVGHSWKITTPKNKQSIRTIDLPNSVKDMLQKRFEHEKNKDGFNMDYFVFGDVRPMSRSDLARKLDMYIRESGVKRITPHGFRHSHASFLIMNGVDDSLIAERLGHTVAELRKTYAHIYKSMRQDMKSLLDEKCSF